LRPENEVFATLASAAARFGAAFTFARLPARDLALRFAEDFRAGFLAIVLV
jgi:hypothetical protein